MFSYLLQQLSAYFMVATFMSLNFVYLKHVRSLFLEAAAIRNKTIASFTQACVVAVGLAILIGDYHSLHSAQAVVRQLVRAGSVATVGCSKACSTND